VQASPLRPEYVFAFPAASGWINCYINERLGAGSVIPGWISHAAGNLASYLGIALGVW
jgi:hypothetical protein